MRKLTLVAVTFAMTVLLLGASNATAQQDRAATKASAATKAGGHKAEIAAIVAVKRGDAVEFTTDKPKLREYVQRAFDNSLRERLVIKDISLRAFEDKQYFVVQIERQGTLFLQLQPSGGGIQGLFNLENDKYLYCASEGCSSCYLTRQGGPVRCECDPVINTGFSSGCKLKAVIYGKQLKDIISNINRLALDGGLEPAEGEGTPVKHPSKVIKLTSTGTRKVN